MLLGVAHSDQKAYEQKVRDYVSTDPSAYNPEQNGQLSALSTLAVDTRIALFPLARKSHVPRSIFINSLQGSAASNPKRKLDGTQFGRHKLQTIVDASATAVSRRKEPVAMSCTGSGGSIPPGAAQRVRWSLRRWTLAQETAGSASINLRALSAAVRWFPGRQLRTSGLLRSVGCR